MTERPPYQEDRLDDWLAGLHVTLCYAARSSESMARRYRVNSDFNRVLFFQVAGNRYDFGDLVHVPREGDLLLIPAHRVTDVELAEGHQERFVSFRLRLPPAGDLLSLVEPRHYHLPAVHVAPGAETLLADLERAYLAPDLAGRLLGHARIMELVQPWLRRLDRGALDRHQAQIAKLLPALERIEKDYAQPLTLEDLAATTGLSRNYFCNRFAALMGMGPMAYLARQRLHAAAALLADGSTPVQAVSAAVGYSDPFHFSRAFRGLYGLSPRAFRARGREF